MLISSVISDCAENICLIWLIGLRRLKSGFSVSGANSKPNCIQLPISFAAIASPAINRENEKNMTRPSISTSSSARTNGRLKRDIGNTISC